MKLRLTGREQTLVLKFQNLPRRLRDKIGIALIEDDHLLLDLDQDELDTLARLGVRTCHDIRKPKTQRAIKAVLRKIIEAAGILSGSEHGFADTSSQAPPGAGDPEDPIIEQMRQATPGWDDMDIRSQIRTLAASGEFENLDHMQRVTDRLVTRSNETPLADFDGLSPRQMHLLLHGDWDEETPGVQVRPALPDDEVAQTDVIRYSRTFLNALIDAEGNRATAKGNLNRKFVMRMVEDMGLPEDYVEYLFKYNKVLNEGDVWVLEELRVVLELGKLIRKYRGKFVATRLGRRLMEPGNLGELFALLFRTEFRVFNLGYRDRLPELPEFQQFLGFSLFRLHGLVEGRWYDLDREAPRLMHPDLAAVLPVTDILDYRRMIVEIRLLRHLSDFGLVELGLDREKGRPSHISRVTRFRITGLLDRLVGFEIE